MILDFDNISYDDLKEMYQRECKANELLETECKKLEAEYKEIEDKNRKLKGELGVYKSNLKSARKEIHELKNMQFAKIQKKQRTITEKQIDEIKKLRDEGLSYRAITKSTGWSSVTINRVLNGIYD